MKAAKDENGVITFPKTIRDRIYMRIMLKFQRMTYRLSKKIWYKNIYYKYLRKFKKINFIEPFEQNSWDEAAVNLNKSIRHETVKKRLIEMKKEMGEAELFKFLKKKLNRKEYKKIMEDITRWKKRGIW